ncbi:MAG TPA: hypothetical protein VD907_02585 [Verrucomicrobiae bacterium]|nr:hypothetical protein [Verrucomicrobiae bacterium]
MYSGTTLRHGSGNIIGTHQKIDRVARRQFQKFIPTGITFPTTRQILRFEGKNGPDGIKRKSPAVDEPWHYFDPTDSSDRRLLVIIEDHLANLTTALSDGNHERAAFEAAWLAHAITDGLTPAHHYPLEEKLSELREGKGLETRTSVKEKLVLPGKTPRQKVRNNWEFWGAKGVMTTHLLFETGVATTVAPLRLEHAMTNANERIRVENEGFLPIFQEIALQIYGLKMYQTFHRHGWSRELARQTRIELAPLIIKAVVLAWYEAALRAAKRKERRKNS